MVTSIQISEEVKEMLQLRKISPKDRYEDVILDLFEDSMELSEQTIKEITKARKEFKEGKFISHTQLKKELGL
jgi:hypothetical protein